MGGGGVQASGGGGKTPSFIVEVAKLVGIIFSTVKVIKMLSKIGSYRFGEGRMWSGLNREV